MYALQTKWLISCQKPTSTWLSTTSRSSILLAKRIERIQIVREKISLVVCVFPFLKYYLMAKENQQTVRLLKLAVKIFVAAERQLMCLNCDRCASNTKMTYWAHAYRFLVSLFDAMRRSIAIKWMDIYERSLDDKASLPYIFRMKSPNMFEMMIRWNINDSKFLIFLIFKS